MKKIISSIVIGAAAAAALVLIVADVPGNMVALAASKIAGAALLLACNWALGKVHPEIMEEEI